MRLSCLASRILPNLFVQIELMLTSIGVHRFENIVSVPPILVSRFNLRNQCEIHNPPSRSCSQNYRNLHMIRAIVACQTTCSQNAKREQKDVIRRLREAASTVVKQPLPGPHSTASHSVYANTSGYQVLKGIQEIKSEFNSKYRKMTKKNKRLSHSVRELTKEKIVAEEQIHSMKHLNHIGSVIRCRFVSKHGKRNGLETSSSTDAIMAGNLAAHTGDIVTDYRLFQQGAITDGDTFTHIYGISPDEVESHASLSHPLS